MQQALKFGIVGAGDAGRRHGRGLANVSDARVAFVADVDADRAVRLAAELGPGVAPVLAHEADWRGVDAVCVCTPPSTHAHWAARAVDAGRHVLVEKPLVGDPAQLAEFEELARRSPGLVGAICQHRFSSAALAVKQRLVRGGAPGRVLSASLRVRRRRDPAYYLEGWKGDPAVAGGGAVMSLGFHALDLVCWWLGRPVEACALARPAAGGRVEAALAGALRFETGELLSIEVAADEGPTSPDTLSLFTAEGEIVWEGDRAFLDGAWLEAGREDLHGRQLADFSAAIRGRPAAAPGVADVKPALAAIAALYESAQRGCATAVAC